MKKKLIVAIGVLITLVLGAYFFNNPLILSPNTYVGKCFYDVTNQIEAEKGFKVLSNIQRSSPDIHLVKWEGTKDIRELMMLNTFANKPQGYVEIPCSELRF